MRWFSMCCNCFSLMARAQITPTYVSDQMSQIDWLHYLTLWEELNPAHRRVGVAVGVEERFLVRAMKVRLTTPFRFQNQLVLNIQ